MTVKRSPVSKRHAEKLQALLLQLRETSEKLYASTEKIGNHLVNHDLFQSITQRSSISGGTCSFDLPEFHYWLLHSREIYLNDLQKWSALFVEIADAIQLVQDFIRGSYSSSGETAVEGFFQVTLDTNLPTQLLRILVDLNLPYFVEISGGKYRCSVRFLTPSEGIQRPVQCIENVLFTLIQCVF